MARTLSVVFAVLLAAVAAPSVAGQKPDKAGQKPDKKDAGIVYDVAVAVENDQYTGTMTLKLDGSKVTGSMAITSPVPVTGDVAGTLEKDQLTLDYPFAMAGDQPCNGQVQVSAKMTSDRSSASGTIHATGCGDQPTDGTITLKKAAKDKGL